MTSSTKVRTAFGALTAVLVLAWSAPVPTAEQQEPRRPQTTFRAGLTLVSVDVVVRDEDGAFVRGLTADDFEVREGRAVQTIEAFSFQEVAVTPSSVGSVDLLAAAEARVAEQALLSAAEAARQLPVEPVPMRSEDLAGRRLIVLLFDTSSMEPEDVQRAVESAHAYVAEQMSPSDLIAVATVSSILNVITDFTADRDQVTAALNTLAWTDGTELPPVDESTAATDEEAATSDEEESEEATELDLFNNDVRLRVLKTLAEALTPIEQKKAIVYFSAGMQRNGQDNQVELRSAINAAVRGNVSIYAIDTRGLQAVVPGGNASQRSGRGRSLFSGRGVARGFSRLASSQGTLTTLAVDTGGRAFTDTNDFGEAFERVQEDMAAYYLLGYVSTNPEEDGRFRRIQVRVQDNDWRVEARAGYYAERDFSHTSSGDREALLEEQLYADIPSTDVPVMAKAGYFRLDDDEYYVPVSVGVPGSMIRVPPDKDEAEIDILGEVRDERGFPVGRIRQTMKLPAGTADTLAGKQVLYQTGMKLPPGRFSIKVVIRENTDGLMGAFEAPVTIPELKDVPLKVSSVILSTQVQPARENKDNPLIRDGIQLLPNLTHVVDRDQQLLFYYEVYDPRDEGDLGVGIRTSLAFYRGRVKVMETPVVVRRAVDLDDRRAAVFQFEVSAADFETGLYTCQVNIIDDMAGTFSFPRLDLYVR